MQADGRLVEHEQGVHQRGTERGGEVDALHLAAREGARLAVEGQVAEADVGQEPEPRDDLAEQQLGGLVDRGRQRQAVDKAANPVHRQGHELMHRQIAEAPQQGLGLEPRTVAGRALGVAAVARQQHPDVHLVGLGLEPLEEMAHPVPLARPGGFPALPGRVAFQHPVAVFLGQVAEWHVHCHAVLGGHLGHVELALAVALGLPGLDRALGEGLRFVRNDESKVDTDDAAETAAGVAGADRRIEGEEARRGFGVMNVAVGAVQVGTVAPLGLARVAERSHRDPPLSDPQRRFDGLDDAALVGVAEPEAVLHHMQHVAVARVDAGVALALEQRGDLGLGIVGRHRHRKAHHQARIAGIGGTAAKVAVDGFGVVAADRLATATAVQVRGARVEQLEVVGQLSHGADRRARGPHRVGLVDGDRRRDALDAVHRRLVHAVEELPRIGRKGLDVAALSFRVERVEDQRTLARTRDAGHHQQLAQRQFEREVLEIVLACAADADAARVLRG